MTDQAAADAIRAHHSELQAEIASRVEALNQAAAAAGWAPARDRLLEFLRGELLPHAAAEERALYPAGLRGRSEMLVAAMLQEHATIIGYVDRLARATDAISAVAAANAILALFSSHLE
jgi:hypothetical protein